MTNGLILAVSQADGLAISATTAASGYPAANVLTSQPGQKWRSTSVASTQKLWGDFGAQVAVDALVVYAHNLTASALLRLELSNNSDYSSPVYDSGDLDASSPSLGWGEWGWDMDYWGGYEPSVGFPPVGMLILPNPYTARYWRVSLTDTGNGDGYLSAGRLMIGQAWRPSENFEWEHEMGWIDPSQMSEAESGALRSENRTPYRTLTLAWRWLDDTDIGGLNDWVRAVGKRNTLFVSPYPDHTSTQEREHSMLARLVDLSPPRRGAHQRYSTEARFQEAV